MTTIMGTPVFSVNRKTGLMLRDNTGMSISARLKQARKDAGMTQGELAARSGLKQSTISDLETGKSQGTTYVASLALAMGVSPLWLEAGKGTRNVDLPDPPAALNEGSPFLKNKVPIRVGDEPETVPIRKVKLKLHAGVAGYETEPIADDGGVLHMPLHLIESANLVPHQLLAIPIKGCSMEPMLFEDDLVVINTADRDPRSRELYAVNFNGEACIKQLIHKAGQWYLHSLNPDYGPLSVRSGQCDIVGRVVYQPGRMVTGRL
ncbi:LexA family transcriptional regulator [Oxalobacteraceae sp. CFBP 8761]|nr:LexA family transcriptional regulator [Oxalobacteraceae sp. CFBP 8761]